MNKKSWFIPILIVAINALAVTVCWNTLSETLPAHYDLQGNAGGTMSRSLLLVYPLIGAAISLIAYIVGCMKQKLQLGLVILASGVCLVLLSSTMVTLTAGTMPVFMLAEPVILLVAVICFVFCVVNLKRRS